MRPVSPTERSMGPGRRYLGKLERVGASDQWQPSGRGRLLVRHSGVERVEYDGEWRGGEMDGRGVFRWADGSSWTGTFRAGNMHGVGQHVSVDGTRRVAFYRKGRRICFAGELMPGVRIRLRQPLAGRGERAGGGVADQWMTATVIDAAKPSGPYRVRVDWTGEAQWVDLALCEFEVDESMPRTIMHEHTVESKSGRSAALR
jgi:hypothetical protein